MTVAELLARVSSKELTRWMVFYEVEPFGAGLPYIGEGIVASNIANVNRQKGKKAYTPDDFIPKFERTKSQSVDDMIDFASMITKAFGGEDKRK